MGGSAYSSAHDYYRTFGEQKPGGIQSAKDEHPAALDVARSVMTAANTNEVSLAASRLANESLMTSPEMAPIMGIPLSQLQDIDIDSILQKYEINTRVGKYKAGQEVIQAYLSSPKKEHQNFGAVLKLFAKDIELSDYVKDAFEKVARGAVKLMTAAFEKVAAAALILGAAMSLVWNKPGFKQFRENVSEFVKAGAEKAAKIAKLVGGVVKKGAEVAWEYTKEGAKEVADFCKKIWNLPKFVEFRTIISAAWNKFAEAVGKLMAPVKEVALGIAKEVGYAGAQAKDTVGKGVMHAASAVGRKLKEAGAKLETGAGTKKVGYSQAILERKAKKGKGAGGNA